MQNISPPQDTNNTEAMSFGEFLLTMPKQKDEHVHSTDKKDEELFERSNLSLREIVF